MTGASRGAGAAIAKSCAGYGAKVIVHYNGNKAAADAVCAEIGSNAIGVVQEDFITGRAQARGFGRRHANLARLMRWSIMRGIDMLSDPEGNDADWDCLMGKNYAG